MDNLAKEFPSAHVEWLKTESSFRDSLEQLIANPPDLTIMDIMLRWADPAPEMPEAPEEVKKEGFYRAGIRCQDLLSSHRETADLPVLLYTLLESSDLGPELDDLKKRKNVTHLRKQSDLTPLFAQIHHAIGDRKR